MEGSNRVITLKVSVTPPMSEDVADDVPDEAGETTTVKAE
jgi:hypothetical protein